MNQKYLRSTNYRERFIRAWPPDQKGKYRCVYCGRRIKKEKMQVDHIIPIDMAQHSFLARRLLPKEGVNSLENLVPACPRCNRKKSNKGGLWLLRGKYWKVCLPATVIMKIAFLIVWIIALFYIFSDIQF